MENKKIQEMFSNAIIKEGFDKYMSYDYRKHMTDTDLIKIHIRVYEYYKINDSVVVNDVFVDNLKKLMEHFIETEDYEKCAFIRDKLNTLKYQYDKP